MTQRLLVALALLFGLAACAGGESTPGGGGEPRTIEVNMTDEFRFEPAQFTVAPGETVRFELTNVGELVHEFLIGDEAAQAEFEEQMSAGEIDHETDAGVSVEPGQTETFDYTFPDAEGELLAGCHEPGHYDGGMVATISVTE